MPNETKHTPGPWRAEMEMEEPEEVGECPWHEACRERVTDCGWTNDKCDKDDDE